jgi:hypothetical protein
MQNIVFFIVGCIQLTIAIIGTRDIRKHFSWYAVCVLIVVYGLAYDNFALASGALFGVSDLTRTLNTPRYIIHGLFTPTMMIAAWGVLRWKGVSWAANRVWHSLLCLLATAMILLGSYVDILNLTLAPSQENGVVRYVNEFHLFKGPPIPAVLTIVVVLILGGIVWRKFKWPWMFVGALLMFFGAASPILIFQNLGEIAIAASLVATIIWANGGFAMRAKTVAPAS